MSAVSFLEHAEDILSAYLAWRRTGPAALVIMTDAVGGAVRSPGALMAISKAEAVGYVSGGCIDADVIWQAREALEKGETRQLRYGQGSPFVDLPLPCGGAIDLIVLPNPDIEPLRTLYDTLNRRQCGFLALSIDGALSTEVAGSGTDSAKAAHCFRYTPKLRMRIAGRGADCIALANIAISCGLPVSLWVRDDEPMPTMGPHQRVEISRLVTPGTLPPANDDPWTAFVLLFHDPDWETPLLQQALTGSAFYVGSVGSPRTHDNRRAALAAAGTPNIDINRIYGPIGMIASMRDASMLAVSIMAEVVDAYHAEKDASFRDCALILLAAGASSRFGDGDKMDAMLGEKPLLEHAASRLARRSVRTRIAVIGPGHENRRASLLAHGWEIALNTAVNTGLGSSIAKGISTIQDDSVINSALLILGDMPFIADSDLRALKSLADTSASTVISQHHDIIMPPALFQRTAFSELLSLSDECGARDVFDATPGGRTLQISKRAAFDIDTEDDLARAQSMV